MNWQEARPDSGERRGRKSPAESLAEGFPPRL